MFSSQVNCLYFTCSSHSIAKDEKTRKKQETTRKPAFYTCEWLTYIYIYNVNTEPLSLSLSLSIYIYIYIKSCVGNDEETSLLYVWMTDVYIYIMWIPNPCLTSLSISLSLYIYIYIKSCVLFLLRKKKKKYSSKKEKKVCHCWEISRKLGIG